MFNKKLLLTYLYLQFFQQLQWGLAMTGEANVIHRAHLFYSPDI
jgi:hypothetical protein